MANIKYLLFAELLNFVSFKSDNVIVYPELQKTSKNVETWSSSPTPSLKSFDAVERTRKGRKALLVALTS